MANTYSVDLDGDDGFTRSEDYKPTVFTFEVWAKPTNFSATMFLFAGFKNDVEFKLDTNGKLVLAVWNGSAYETVTDTDLALAVGVWNHCAVSFDGTNVKFYKNGAAQGTGTATLSYEAGTGQTYAWGSRNGANFFLGKLDDARNWGDVRTATEILNNYGIETIDTGNLDAYYKFNNNPNDDSGNSRTLTAVGDPAYVTDDLPFGGAGFFAIL